MRFVSPETVRIDLEPGPKGEPRWIEVKKELSALAKNRYRKGALIPVIRYDAQGKPIQELRMDLDKLEWSQVEAYLWDWSAKDENGKDKKVTTDAIEALDDDSFKEIAEAIQAYVDKQEQEKKATKKDTSKEPIPISR